MPDTVAYAQSSSVEAVAHACECVWASVVRCTHKDIVDYVLSPFAAGEREVRDVMSTQAMAWVETLLESAGHADGS